MDDFRHLRLMFTRHALIQMAAKDMTVEQASEVFAKPARCYPNGRYPGQYRVTGRGICLVGEPRGEEFVIVTVYSDEVLTPPRPDQMLTPEGRRYAQRYAQGLGRG